MTPTASLAVLLEAYVDDPGPDTLAPLRAVVRRAPNHSRDLVPAAVVGPLQRAGDHQGVVRAVTAMMPGALLSPSAHLALAAAYDALGDRARAERELRLARAAVAGIRASGDGTDDRPWKVLRVSDEYDVLRALGTSATAQRVHEVDGRTLDRLDAADGRAYVFDVTGVA